MKYAIFLWAMSVSCAVSAMNSSLKSNFWDAVFVGEHDIAVSILKRYPNIIYEVGEFGTTFLFDARSVAIAQLLLDAGSDVNHCSKRGETPLFWLVESMWNASYLGTIHDMVQLFLQHGACLNHEDENGHTAAHERCLRIIREIKAWEKFGQENIDGNINYTQKLMEQGAVITAYGPLLKAINEAIYQNKDNHWKATFERLKGVACTGLSIAERMQYDNKLQYDFACLVCEKNKLEQLSPKILSVRCPQLKYMY